ncbi:uncharacterized protein LOC125679441 [Ostrea edulis]|uniref:uncharacterized protein LOC125679441 n=1 Tax=Ostrea edulis TaxID=37623 RepID=UPI0020957EE3|nr:uncharacterized protein LOC125679441 [Ostrea edulis]
MAKRKSDENWGNSERPRKRLSKGETSGSVEDALTIIEKQVQIVRDIKSQENTHSLHAIIDQLQKKLEAEKKAKSEALKTKEDALNRLSSVAANRLRDNNPGITDLSDPNRPIKLGEKASEIYDNEWTNALENLEELRKATDVEYDEEQDVMLLLSILTDIFQMCIADTTEHIENISRMLLSPALVKIKHKPKVPSVFLKEIKDFRRQHCTESVLQSLTEHYVEKLPDHNPEQLTPDVMKACKEYIHRCVELSWLMSIQDPPMCMEWQFQGCKFRRDIMRSFTKSGDKVQFVVWPALYLHDGGPLVAKAIVQGVKTEKKRKRND